MIRNILILLLFFNAASLFAQIEEYDTFYFEDEEMIQPMSLSSTLYKSSYGHGLPTKGVMRGLTIFVSIIYDQNDTIDQRVSTGSMHWQRDITSSINNPNVMPTYLLDLFDTQINPTYNGIITRLYAEASFDSLILLSDFIVVNIKQSQITPNNPRANFSMSDLTRAVITYINQNGGLNAIYGHNSI